MVSIGEILGKIWEWLNQTTNWVLDQTIFGVHFDFIIEIHYYTVLFILILLGYFTCAVLKTSTPKPMTLLELQPDVNNFCSEFSGFSQTAGWLGGGEDGGFGKNWTRSQWPHRFLDLHHVDVVGGSVQAIDQLGTRCCGTGGKVQCTDSTYKSGAVHIFVIGRNTKVKEKKEDP